MLPAWSHALLIAQFRAMHEIAAKASVHLHYIVLKVLTGCDVAKHLPQKPANAYSNLAASAQTPPEEQARLLAAINCHQDKHRDTTQSSIRSTCTWVCMHSNAHIVMIFCLSASRSTGSSLLLGDATHNVIYSQQHDCTFN